jgi:hypothetical protein
MEMESTLAGDDGWWSEGYLTVDSLTIDMLGLGDAMRRYWQMPHSVARLLFMHAERIISSNSLGFHAIPRLYSAAGFDLLRLAKDNFRLRY